MTLKVLTKTPHLLFNVAFHVDNDFCRKYAYFRKYNTCNLHQSSYDFKLKNCHFLGRDEVRGGSRRMMTKCDMESNILIF